MKIPLFEHNQTAYAAAAAMLSETGKAAVIHPTGTGKSFIGFKLCEEHPAASILWLSPSEYIFRTQLENLRKTGASVPENICFVTYAKLSLLEEAELSALEADFIVLDEFHRAGAEIWGRAIAQLLASHPEARILGLSATNIRYLDNRRDMAQELFDGNVASEMSLGEAIVRGIIHPAKYVLSVFSCENELKRYRKRVEKCQSPWVKDEAQRYLEALQRTLENAEGLDVLFEKHMEDRTGKYIVFCANYEHMKTMISVSKDWFRKIDAAPKIYSVYSGDLSSSQSFADFREDRDSKHLRLLFCIDALNEGIHLEDISGVILLRPTVSPIIYKQQIGRALSAGGSDHAVIFDIVDNISGLYSIDAIREEMDLAMENFRYLGEDRQIVVDTFQVLDELRDCRELFDQLENTLSASWEQMFAMAKSYYEENGDLLPPASFRTENGYRLGQWVIVQRVNYHSATAPLSEERIRMLESVGMCWEPRLDRLWNETFAAVKKYFEENGSLDGIREASDSAASWLIRQRQKYKAQQLTEEQIGKLESVGMVWETEDRWMASYEAAREYFLLHGDLDIPVSYVTPSGIPLGGWYRGVRNSVKNGSLSPERRKLLDAIGFSAVPVKKRTWMGYYGRLKEYAAAHGNADVPNDYVCADGKKLGVWVTSQRNAYLKKRLSQEHIRQLEKLGFVWNVYSDRWNAGFSHAESYRAERGDLNVPAGYLCADGFALGHWIAMQRDGKKQGILSAERIGKLEALGMRWSLHRDLWDTGYEQARKYYLENGNLKVSSDYVTPDGFRLGAWLSAKKTKYKKGTLPADAVSALEALGIQWSPLSDSWQKGYDHAEEYSRSLQGRKWAVSYISPDGYRTGEWIRSQLRQDAKSPLPGEKRSALMRLGFLPGTTSAHFGNPVTRMGAE